MTRSLGAVILGALLGAGPTAAAGDEWEALALTRAPAGIAAPEFTLPDSRGWSVKLADLRGRPLLVNFWATWCLPCEMEMPALQRLHRRLGGGTAVVAVNYREAPERVRAFAERYELEFPLLLDRDGAVTGRFKVAALPFTVLIGRDGEVVAVAAGPRNWDSPEAMRLLERVRGQ